MITVWINGQQRDGIDEGWIVRTIQGLRHDGESVCVRVGVKRMGLDLTVTAGVCPSGGAGREPNADERRIFDPGTVAACMVTQISRQAGYSSA